MNRRQLLCGAGSAVLVGAAPAQEPESDLYWQAQQSIGELTETAKLFPRSKLSEQMDRAIGLLLQIKR